MATKTKPRSLTLRDYELRRLLDTGSVCVVRAIPKAFDAGEWASAVVQCSADGSWFAWWGTYRTAEQWQAKTDELYPNGGGFLCPFGRVGDTVAVREGWRVARELDSKRAADFAAWPAQYRIDMAIRRCGGFYGKPDGKWRSPATMPAWAVRLRLTLTAVRVARVQEIDKWNARAMGITVDRDSPNRVAAARMVWDAHTRNPAHKWEANPWCFVGTFTRSER